MQTIFFSPGYPGIWLKSTTLALGTFAWYSLHDSQRKNGNLSWNLLNPKQKYWDHYRHVLIVFMAVAGTIALAASFWIFTYTELAILLVTALLSAIYTFGLPRLQRKISQFIIKPVLLALIWTLPTSLPWIAGLPDQPYYFAALLLLRFAFMLLLCIPFELKDLDADNALMDGNILQFIPRRNLELILIILFGLGVGQLIWFVVFYEQKITIWIWLIFHLVITLILALKTLRQPRRYFLYILLDLMMIVQTLGLWIVH